MAAAGTELGLCRNLEDLLRSPNKSIRLSQCRDRDESILSEDMYMDDGRTTRIAAYRCKAGQATILIEQSMIMDFSYLNRARP